MLIAKNSGYVAKISLKIMNRNMFFIFLQSQPILSNFFKIFDKTHKSESAYKRLPIKYIRKF